MPMVPIDVTIEKGCIFCTFAFFLNSKKIMLKVDYNMLKAN